MCGAKKGYGRRADGEGKGWSMGMGPLFIAGGETVSLKKAWIFPWIFVRIFTWIFTWIFLTCF